MINVAVGVAVSGKNTYSKPYTKYNSQGFIGSAFLTNLLQSYVAN